MNPHHNKKWNSNKLSINRIVTVVVLLALVVIGLASTTFATFVSPSHTGDSGSLIADILSQTVNRNTKKDITEIGAVVDNAYTKANVDVAETKATVTYEEGDILFFNMKGESWWETASAGGGNYAYFFNNSTGMNAWSAKAVQYSGDIYYVKVPAGTWAGVILTRNNTTTSPSWDNDWNQTGDLTLQSDKNYISDFANGSTSATWSTQKPSSNASLAANSATINVGVSNKLIPSLTSNTTYNEINSVSYSIDPSTGASISGDMFTATASGTYTVTATITYNPRGYSNLTSTATASTTITVNDPKYTYTITAGAGGSVLPKSGSVTAGNSVNITATPNTGFTFAGWTGATNGTVGSVNLASTTFTPSANGATVKANFRPNTPSALTLTGSPVAAGTTGDGTASNPFIVFENSDFTITAKATVATGASAHYSTASNGTYNTTNTFKPAITTKGVDLSYSVYSKAYVSGYYSSSYKSATAHYMVFSHLNGTNTGFTTSSDSITDAETLTLSGAYVNGVVDAEKAYITQTYQVSSDNSTFSDLSGTTWTPVTTGTFYFRVKTTNTKTGETVYSTSKNVIVTQSTVYYDITVTKVGSYTGTVTLKSNGTPITDNKILSSSPLEISLSRPSSDYYIKYLEVDTMTTEDCENVNGNITDYEAYQHVKANVVIKYELALKPQVSVKKPVNASSISFDYYVDGVNTNITSVGSYYIDYNSDITYSVTPETGYYVNSMTGVEMGIKTSSTTIGTKSNVKSNISEVTAVLVENNTVIVNIDSTSVTSDGASMIIDGTAQAFGDPKPLNYGAQAEIVITPPDGCYALVDGAQTSTDGKATFSVTLEGSNQEYTVKFIQNPKIYMVQPQYGSVYVTSGTGDNTVYYFNGDSVGYGTELTVHVKPDHTSAILSEVLVNDASIGTADGSKFQICEDSTATATITVDSKFAFDSGTEYGKRRIFFTDNAKWGDGNVSVHPSTISGDTAITSNSVVMTFKYTNDMDQRVYYADIPYSANYVTFYNKSNTSQKTNQAAIPSENNAFWNNNGTLEEWRFVYSDFVAADRADTIQQGVTVKNEPVTFQYACDYGDDVLSAEVLGGNAVTVDFNKGVLSITPTENTSAFTLVKVSSTASTTVKYYLVRVDNFEIVSFKGLQKIYSSNVFNNIQLELIVKGGVLNYAAKLFVSDSNMSGTYNELVTDDTNYGFEYSDSLEAYINRFTISYHINTMSGVKYYKVDASDSANHKATSTMKTLFGTNTYEGTRCVYFYNNTSMNLSKHVVRACFNDASNTNHRFVTMQKVGNTDYYRAVVPNGYESSVNFYLCNKNTFSNNIENYRDSEVSKELFTYGVSGVIIPDSDDANIVYAASSADINNGITGEFVGFDY